MSAYCGLPVRCELTLPGRTLDLMDAGQGFRIASLDLAFPAVRENVNDAPDRDGTLDETSFFSGRAVTIAGTIVASPSGSRSASLALLSPFMDPSVRPVLIFQTEADVPARQITLRAADLSAPFDSPSVTAWSASWKAPSGLALGVDQLSATVGPSWLIEAGRKYDLVFDRKYPQTGYSDSTTFVAGGDYPTPPVFVLYGPATGTTITVDDETAGTRSIIQLKQTFTVPAGRSVVIDADAHTITMDDGTNVYGDALDGFADWPTFVPGNTTTVSFYAQATAGSTYMTVSWYERWLI